MSDEAINQYAERQESFEQENWRLKTEVKELRSCIRQVLPNIEMGSAYRDRETYIQEMKTTDWIAWAKKLLEEPIGLGDVK